MKRTGFLSRIFVIGGVSALALHAAWAAEPADREIRAAAVPVSKLRSNGRKIATGKKAALIVDGIPFDFHGATLMEQDGQLLVPLRPVCLAIGAKISFDTRTSTAKATRNGHFISIKFDGALPQTLFPLAPLCAGLDVRLTTTSRGALTLLRIDSNRPNPVVEPPTPNPATPSTAPGDSKTASVEDIAAHIQHNLDRINAYRAKAGAPALTLDDQLTAFAKAGSQELMQNHVPHNHFKNGDIWNNGFTSNAAENQGDPHGWFPGPVDKVIDDILQSMMDEGPGGGHHDNILNPAFRRLGVGLIEDGDGKLYLTNDFSA